MAFCFYLCLLPGGFSEKVCQLEVALLLGDLHWRPVIPVPDICGRPRTWTFCQDPGQLVEAVVGREMKQGRVGIYCVLLLEETH